jgi:FKBP-type peptidyl-prolyl cis-trans isomerase 2
VKVRDLVRQYLQEKPKLSPGMEVVVDNGKETKAVKSVSVIGDKVIVKTGLKK